MDQAKQTKRASVGQVQTKSTQSAPESKTVKSIEQGRGSSSKVARTYVSRDNNKLKARRSASVAGARRPDFCAHCCPSQTDLYLQQGPALGHQAHAFPKTHTNPCSMGTLKRIWEQRPPARHLGRTKQPFMRMERLERK